MKFPFAKPCPADIEKRRIEILSEMEDFQRKLLLEMSGVDKLTLQRLREIMKDYYNIKNNLSSMLATFETKSSRKIEEYETSLSTVNDEFIEALKNTVNSYIMKDVFNQSVNDAVSTITAAGISEIEDKTEDGIRALSDFIEQMKEPIKDEIITLILDALPTAEGGEY